jgi:ATP-dependent exoDNAse (exonuclease V) beta subunit
VLDEQDGSFELFEEEDNTEIPDFFLGNGPTAPKATERGTATHLFLQFCDFKRATVHGAREELARLVEERFLPQNIADMVYVEELERFLQSDLARRIQKAKTVIRERRFNLYMDSESFTTNDELKRSLQGEKLAVQGVIDLILIDEEDRICLFDYKTDRLSREERDDPILAAKKMNRLHGLQLSYYAYAAERLFGRPCHQICVYSTHSGALYDITATSPCLPENTLDRL